MPRVLVLNVVGLTPDLLRHAPRLAALAGRGRVAALTPPLPAVTCTSQTSILTGKTPRDHGIVGNGWYDRASAETRFWKQADGLVRAPRLFGPDTNNLFWWYAMYSPAAATVTPRPQYPADGRKVPDLWASPPDLRDHLQEKLGRFPLFRFWGPLAGIESSRWIADATIETHRRHPAAATFVYLPHLDYPLQRLGPADPAVPAEVAAVDAECGKLLDHFADARLFVLSEYGVTAAETPVHLNRVLRRADLLSIRREDGGDLLDAGASRAFAVADHQLAHVYVRDPADRPRVRGLLAGTPGVAEVLDADGKRAAGLDHPRSGDLIALAERTAWFTYYYWGDGVRPPDFARTVDIHRKPGYDPVELFTDASRAAVARKLALRKLGFRTLLDVIPTDATLVKGTHGLLPPSPDAGPLVIGSDPDALPSDALDTAALHVALRDAMT